jgi:hypothetical protein
MRSLALTSSAVLARISIHGRLPWQAILLAWPVKIHSGSHLGSIDDVSDQSLNVCQRCVPNDIVFHTILSFLFYVTNSLHTLMGACFRTPH